MRKQNEVNDDYVDDHHGPCFGRALILQIAKIPLSCKCWKACLTPWAYAYVLARVINAVHGTSQGLELLQLSLGPAPSSHANYKGEMLAVKVLPKGLEFERKIYRSLSDLAKAMGGLKFITGIQGPTTVLRIRKFNPQAEPTALAIPAWQNRGQQTSYVRWMT